MLKKNEDGLLKVEFPELKFMRLFMITGKTIKALFLTALLILPGVYCSESTDSGNGTLTVKLSDGMDNGKTILPSIDMSIAAYNITSTCTGETEVSVLGVAVSESSVEIDGLASGSWTITVSGVNADDTVIGMGVGTVDIAQGEDSTLSVVVSPLAGNGTLSLTASWDTASVGSSPELIASLTPVGGSAGTISFTIDVSQGTATYSNSAIPAGYYLLSLVLYDNEVNCGGAAEIVRIAEDQTSSGTISLSVNVHGVIVVTITQLMNDPVILTLENTMSSITTDSSMTITASTSNATDVVYSWYVDGISITADDEDTCTVNGDSLTEGQHRLDVIAITSDQARAGSTSHTFTVTQ